jgi:hypothetical protein
MLNARIRISAERQISCKYLILMPRSGFRCRVGSSVRYLRVLNTKIRIYSRWRVESSVPDAECQDPDFDGEADLLYLMLKARIRISVKMQISCT